jgi:hypothetical protein
MTHAMRPARPGAAEPVRLVTLAPLTALPEGWRASDDPIRSPWDDVELGSANGTYRIVGKRGDRQWSVEVSSGADGVVVESFDKIAKDAAALVFDENHDGGKRVVLVVCARDPGTVVACSAPIELQNGDLRDELAYKLFAVPGGLELRPTGSGATRRLELKSP